MTKLRTCPHCGNVFCDTTTAVASSTKYCSLNCAVESRVDKDDADGCWPWTGGLDPHGYPQLGFRPRSAHALKGHRMALELSLDRRLTAAECALHTCDNPACCRVHPDHVRLGTRGENMVECHEKGRGSRPPRRSERLTVAQHEEIARRRAAGEEAARIAADFGITRHTVYQSRRRKRSPGGPGTGPARVLSDEQIVRARAMRADGHTIARIAADVGASEGAIGNAVAGVTHAHLNDIAPPTVTLDALRERRKPMGNAKLNGDDVLAIYRRLASGGNPATIARDFDVAAITVRSIASGRTWRELHVTPEWAAAVAGRVDGRKSRWAAA